MYGCNKKMWRICIFFFVDSSWFINNVTNTVTYLITGGNFTAEDNNVTYTYSYEPCPPNGCPPPGIDYGPYESRYNAICHIPYIRKFSLPKYLIVRRVLFHLKQIFFMCLIFNGKGH